ncbi:MAG: FecR family protein [Treponema sp.]|nr:FecR family protein [Treponema sp.]
MAGKSSKSGRALGPADYMIIIFCLGGAFFCLRSFWIDFNQTLSQQNAAPVGVISWKYKAAQRRFTDRVIWDRLQRESPVYDGDYVRTAELSEATVTFTGGIIIDLAENSLIQIFLEDSVPRLDLTQGGVSVDAAVPGSSSALLLNAGGRSISVSDGAVLDTRIDGDGSFSLRVNEGSANIVQNGEIQEILAGQAIVLDAEGRVFEDPQTVMLSPKPVARLLQSGETPLAVTFVWNPQNYGGSDRTRIEIAADRGFRRILRTLDGEQQIRASVDLMPGVYFWRAYPVSGADVNAAWVTNAGTGKLTIVSVPVPRTLSPEEGYNYRYRNSPPAVRFQWTASPEISFYMLEAADNPALTNPVLQTLVRGGEGDAISFSHSGLGTGRWYWQVTPVFTDEYEGKIAPSSIASFTVTQSGTLEAPTLLGPRAETILNIGEAAAPAGRQDFVFSWQNEAEADLYTLLISASPDLRDPLITRQVDHNYAVYGAKEALLGEGRYYWGVYQTDAEGAVSAVSPSRPFTIHAGEIVLQPIFPPDNYTVTNADLPDTRFAWRTNLSGPLRFQISDTPDFSRLVIDEIAAGESFRGQPLEDGRWYWRITAQAGAVNRQTMGRSFQVVPPPSEPPPPRPAPALPSAPARITPVPPPLLPEALGRLPENEYIIGPVQLRKSRIITFAWNPVLGADAYIFTLYKEEAGSRRLIQRWASARNTRSLYDLSLLENGRFIWQVEAISQAADGSVKQHGTVGENSFTVEIPVLRRNTANSPGVVYGR